MIQSNWGAFIASLFFILQVHASDTFDSQWLKLLRYNSYGTSFESEADSSSFFLTQNGKTNPEAEYQAFIDFMKTPVTGDDHPVCKFPARALKIFHDKNGNKPDFSNCEKLNRYLKATDPKGASLVFASYFIQKPSSAFGHTFLRLHTNRLGNAALLDFAVDFAASVDTQNPIAYGVKGIIGGFKGRFSRMPYFLKIREYADLDSRDVWEYPLNLSKPELLMLTFHLWEMDQAYFDYYYFSENCSYHILRAIEAVTNKDIAQDLKFFVLPIDTIHALNKNNVLLSPKRIPSQYSKVKAALEGLSQDNKNIVLDFYRNPYQFNLSSTNDTKVVDALVDVLNYKFAEGLLTDSSDDQTIQLREDLLLKRSQMGSSKSSIISTIDSPSSGHYGSFLDLSYSYADQNSIKFNHAFALHEFRHSPKGFSNKFQMTMGEVQLSILKNNIVFDSFEIFDVMNASSSFSLEFNPSWRFSLGVSRDFSTTGSVEPFILFNSGVSLLANDNYLINLSLSFRPRYQSFANHFQLPVGVHVISQINAQSYQLGVESSIYRNFDQRVYEFWINPYYRYLIKNNVELFINSSHRRSQSEYSSGMTYFY